MITKERLEAAISQRKGFTLIEILIVVAIIAILASVVLVGLGPTQQSGRDARRISDLKEIQNGLELFYNKCGFYPGLVDSSGACTAGTPGTTWDDLATALTSSSTDIGVGTVPNDPSSNRSYGYDVPNDSTSYVLGAALENANNSVLNGYTPPANIPTDNAWLVNSVTITPNTACTGVPAGGSNGATYCVTL